MNGDPLRSLYHSVEESAASPGTTVAVQFVAGVFNGELVVIGELLPPVDFS